MVVVVVASKLGRNRREGQGRSVRPESHGGEAEELPILCCCGREAVTAWLRWGTFLARSVVESFNLELGTICVWQALLVVRWPEAVRVRGGARRAA